MNIQEWKGLVKGDQIVYDGKPDEIWIVDHPSNVSTKKSWRSHGDYSTPDPCGGGECPEAGICVRASIIRPRGRGMARLFETFSDPEPWTKL